MNCEYYNDCRLRILYGCEVADCREYKLQRWAIENTEEIQVEHQRLLGKVLEKDTRPTRIKLEDLGIRVKE